MQQMGAQNSVPKTVRRSLVRARDCADYLASKGHPQDGRTVLQVLLAETQMYEELGVPWAAPHRDACERALHIYSQWWGLQ